MNQWQKLSCIHISPLVILSLPRGQTFHWNPNNNHQMKLFISRKFIMSETKANCHAAHQRVDYIKIMALPRQHFCATPFISYTVESYCQPLAARLPPQMHLPHSQVLSSPWSAWGCGGGLNCALMARKKAGHPSSLHRVQC